MQWHWLDLKTPLEGSLSAAAEFVRGCPTGTILLNLNTAPRTFVSAYVLSNDVRRILEPYRCDFKGTLMVTGWRRGPCRVALAYAVLHSLGNCLDPASAKVVFCV